MQQNQVRSIVYSLQQNIRRVIVGKDEALELALIALLCKGHVLIEDVPGVGKTTLVAALARSLSCSFKRIQFTPDVPPAISRASPCLRCKRAKWNIKAAR